MLDPWQAAAAYWVGGAGGLQGVVEGKVGEVWQVPVSPTGEEGRYPTSLTFLSPTMAAVGDGGGLLYLLDTGAREHGAAWNLLFSGDVCGARRPFVVAGGRAEGEAVEVVVQYVERRESVEGVRLPQGEGDFLNCLDWISLAKEGQGVTMERVRRVVTRGGVNYVGVLEGEGGEGRLVVSAEKAAVVVFDSMDPVMEEEEEEVLKREGDAPVFYWSQVGGEDLELWVYVGEVVRSAVKVVVEGRSVAVEVRGVEVVAGTLAGEVEQGTCTWSLEGGRVQVMLTKASAGPWPALWGRAGGSRGEQVEELGEDTVLPHLTTDRPIAAQPELQPGLNSEELEECDTCDTEDRLVWGGGGGVEVASLEGRQHLLTLPSAGGAAPQLCTRHDVDGLVWRLEGEGAVHVATFPALGYVQASKTQRRFLAAPPSAGYSVICDATRHLYIYRQPEALAQELGLRNRHSGQRVEKVARQQVVTLDSQEEVVGLVAAEASVFVLMASSLTILAVG